MQSSTAQGTPVHGSGGGTDNFAVERTRFACLSFAKTASGSLDGRPCVSGVLETLENWYGAGIRVVWRRPCR
jgi:hypothetical protein